MDEINYKPIGIIHSPFKEVKGTPIQARVANNIDGRVEIFPEYVEGLTDLDDFSHIILIYHFNRSKKYILKVKPFIRKAKISWLEKNVHKLPGSKDDGRFGKR